MDPLALDPALQRLLDDARDTTSVTIDDDASTEARVDALSRVSPATSRRLDEAIAALASDLAFTRMAKADADLPLRAALETIVAVRVALARGDVAAISDGPRSLHGRATSYLRSVGAHPISSRSTQPRTEFLRRVLADAGEITRRNVWSRARMMLWTVYKYGRTIGDLPLPPRDGSSLLDALGALRVALARRLDTERPLGALLVLKDVLRALRVEERVADALIDPLREGPR